MDSDDSLVRLQADDATVRRLAVLELADLEDEEYLPALSAALARDPDAEVRAEAARVLAGWDRAEVVDALAAALLDSEPRVRELAAQSLSELKDPSVGARLLPYARHEQAFVRASALHAMRELRIPEAAEPAEAALEHADPSVRREGVSVLGWLRHGPALPRLAALARNDDDVEVRRIAIGALGFADASVLSALLSALEDEAWIVREEAATTLAKLRLSEALPALCAAMDDPYWQVRVRAARALGRLADPRALEPLLLALAHEVSNLRKEAAIALGELGDLRARPALEASASDADPEVRKAVRVALTRLAA